ncbi:hypothetical protein DPMN_094235 [Dreissena polymorpha]|uniref:Uncharacterized protein n=1 Tax=Dreissena polymorpha TaxID=45954 RepID=A0A9D4L4F5_DREPO|nr:hypothetical protein DPMN_094235 [Dreissena polymorpha]
MTIQQKQHLSNDNLMMKQAINNLLQTLHHQEIPSLQTCKTLELIILLFVMFVNMIKRVYSTPMVGPLMKGHHLAQPVEMQTITMMIMRRGKIINGRRIRMMMKTMMVLFLKVVKPLEKGKQKR